MKTHPDRVPNDSPERAERTRKFQLVNDAYFTLSDAGRRRDYDSEYKMYGNSSSRKTAAGADPFEDFDFDEEIPPQTGAGGGFPSGGQSAYSWAWNYFTGRGNTTADREQTGNQQFSDVFEEMMRDEGMAEDGTNQPTGKFWSLVGGVSGGAMGFIVANVTGMVAGAVAGNRLGAVRDAKGKSVWGVFQVSINNISSLPRRVPSTPPPLLQPVWFQGRGLDDLLVN